MRHWRKTHTGLEGKTASLARCVFLLLFTMGSEREEEDRQTSVPLTWVWTHTMHVECNHTGQDHADMCISSSPWVSLLCQSEHSRWKSVWCQQCTGHTMFSVSCWNTLCSLPSTCPSCTWSYFGPLTKWTLNLKDPHGSHWRQCALAGGREGSWILNGTYTVGILCLCLVCLLWGACS